MLFGAGIWLSNFCRTVSGAAASLLNYIINGKTPDLVADFNGSLNDGTEFYDAGGTVDTFAELITHSRAGNATMTDGYGPELASNVAADWVPFSGGSAVQDGEWIVITGASASSSGVILPLATEVGKQYAWTMEIELLTATVFLTQLQKPTNSQDAFSPTSFEYVTTNRTIIYQGIHTHTTAGSRLSAWPSGVGLTARIRNVSVREVPAIKWAPHNLVAYSEQFDNPGWQKTNTTVINNQTAAPDGSLTADKVIINSASFSYVRNLLAIDACQNTFGFFAKAGTTSNIQIYIIEQGVASGTADIDLSTGTVSNVAGVFTGGVTATDVGNGWYLIKGTRTFTASALNHRVGIAATGQNGLDFYIWGAHAYRSDLGGMVDNPETGDSYVPTTSSAVYLPRRNHHVYNGDAWVNEGVLHESEARTNLFTSSNSLATATNITATLNNIVSPDGKINGTLLSNQGGNWHYYHSPISLIQNTQYTLSCYAKYKAGSGFVWLLCEVSSDAFVMFDILDGVAVNLGTGSQQADSSSIEDAGNGWFRISATFTKTSAGALDSIGIGVSPTSTQPNWDATGLEDTEQAYVYGFQTEAGSTPSSLIPTNGATVSRALETLTIPAANMPWPEPNYIGPELVVNGDFSNGTTDWTTAGDVSISVVGGELQLVRNTTGYQAYQAVSTQVGATYVVSSKARVSTADYAYFGASTIAGGANLLSVPTSSASMVTLSGFFVATGTTTYIFFGSGNVGDKTVYFDNVSVKEIDPLSVSIQMQGRMTYADEDSSAEVVSVRWLANGSNYITQRMATHGTRTGSPYFLQRQAGTTDDVIGDITAYSPGVFVPFNIASRHGSTFINGANDGVALTANTKPVALPDLSATDFNLGYDYMGTISMLRVWADDLADVGIAEATEPSEVPSLQLTFDNSETSFTIQDWEQ